MLMDSFYPLRAADYLTQEFRSRLRRRPHYSLRAFARDLEVSPSTLSEFLNGKTGFSPERAQSIARKIQLTESQADHFCDLVEAKSARLEQDRQAARLRARRRSRNGSNALELDRFQVITDWPHFPIVELLALDSSYQKPAAIAKALGITQDEAERSLDRLVRVGILVRTENGLEAASDQTVVDHEIPSTAVRQHHHQLLDLAHEALEKQPMETRQFESTVFSMRSQDIPAFRKDLEKMARVLVDKYHSKDAKDRVSALCCQFFHFNHGK